MTCDGACRSGMRRLMQEMTLRPLQVDLQPKRGVDWTTEPLVNIIIVRPPVWARAVAFRASQAWKCRRRWRCFQCNAGPADSTGRLRRHNECGYSGFRCATGTSTGRRHRATSAERTSSTSRTKLTAKWME